MAIFAQTNYGNYIICKVNINVEQFPYQLISHAGACHLPVRIAVYMCKTAAFFNLPINRRYKLKAAGCERQLVTHIDPQARAWRPIQRN